LEGAGMTYRVTCLTPTLVGDGQKLAPIDYMVWREQVNVLDQRRIFRLLAKGPRLDGYLAQLRKADRLDFASWGGFAQNFAGRRIPFEHASSIPIWERAQTQNLFIPTFAAAHAGPFLPATSVKGALRTGTVFDRWSEGTLRDVASRMTEDRAPRNPGARAEESVLGGANNRMKRVAAGDSACVPYSGMKVYLLRVATLVSKGPAKFEVAWKSPRGSAETRRIEESTPAFAEMAQPGVRFEGIWREQSETDRHRIFAASNRYAAAQLAKQKQYAAWTGLARLASAVAALETRLAEVTERRDACLLSLGWGAGMLSKVAVGDTEGASYRAILKQVSLYKAALQTGLPFPKTRKIVFEGGEPSQLPGWVLLEVV
jgi:CRISPR-associated protein Csm5